MERKSVERRLAAILCADVAGYSRLMGEDESGTLARLLALRREVVDPQMTRHEGRVVKTAGDSVLVEFPSVVNALIGAVEVQREMAARNAGVPGTRRIDFRIGINLGDVILEEGDIFGDGVNVAARLQELAEPGGIYVSSAVHDQIGERVEAVFEDLGERSMKNIARPVHVYRVRMRREEGAARTPGEGPGAASSVSDKPSIAVLPFTNMSGDPEQEFFTDGITEDILTELSRFRDLFVIARNSTFAYKGKAVNIREVAKELGVHYVVEGSVRKAANRVRVTVQLIDAETGRHVWAERYDRDLEDIFAIQDEITRSIVATLPGRVEAATRERAAHKPTENLAAYESVLAAKVLHHRGTPEENLRAQHLLDRAIALDPRYAHAHAWKACVLGQSWLRGWAADREATWERIFAELQTALALDDNDSDIHRILAAVYLQRREFDKAFSHQERGLSLNPNYDLLVVQKGEILTWLGRPEEGIEWIRNAMRLNPYHPERYWTHLGRAYYLARRYGEAVEAIKRLESADHTAHALLAACYAQLGDEAAARKHAREVLAREPAFSVGGYLETLPYKQESDRAHHREGLVKAGLPA